MAKQYDYDDENENYSSGSGMSNKLTYLLVGGGIGAVLALLFAPKSGTELRGDIADASRKGLDKSLEYGQQLGEKSGEYLEQAKQAAGGVYSRAGDAYTAARDKFSRTAEQAADAVPQLAGGGDDAAKKSDVAKGESGMQKDGGDKEQMKKTDQPGA